MKDKNRIGVLIGLGLLFLVLALVVPHLNFEAIFRPLRHVPAWLIFIIFWFLFWGRGGCCKRRRCRKGYDDEEKETAEA